MIERFASIVSILMDIYASTTLFNREQDNDLGGVSCLGSFINLSHSRSAYGEYDRRPGGIDLSQIELTLKDEKFISSLNPAERKVLLAAKYLKEGWESRSLLYVHEIMLLLKDNLIKDIQNRNLLFGILRQLQIKDFLDPQAQSFFKFLQTCQPLSEMSLALYK